MFACVIRYTVNPDKLAEFEQWAAVWIRLIRKFGGVHLGYFLPPKPGESVPDAKFSFPGLGTAGPPNSAIAVFCFPDVEAYDRYRKEADQDPDAIAAHTFRSETQCFLSYERFFLIPHPGNPV
jgi:hypothetical protein